VNFPAAEILLIEDNPSDVRYTELVFEDLGVANRLTALPDGEEALQYLYRRGKYTEAPRPNCILLDWNLPKADGSEVLEILRKDNSFNDIPIIILTGSREEIDVVAAYHLKADGYVTKPIDLSGLHTIMETCDFRSVLTPKPERPDR
jgi:two-component system response regulator